MKKHNQFICPKDNTPLQIEIIKGDQNHIVEGQFKSNNSDKVYPIEDDIINLSYPEILPEEEQNIMNWYKNNYQVYDDYLPITFDTFNVNEKEVRESMIDALDIQPGDKVLETGAGTGRDSEIIASRLGSEGEFHVTDIYSDILRLSKDKLNDCDPTIYHAIVNAIHLPYPDNYFDKYYHFGGWNTFSDKKKAFEEVNRVVKPGGKVIVGDESMPEWLLGSDFANILINTNHHYAYPLPLKDMHHSSRNVSIQYLIGGVFYYISYDVGEGYPEANFEIPIPGSKGGTLNSRYWGKLEGVSEATFNLVQKAISRSGKSSFEWLDAAIKEAAQEELKKC